MEKIEWLPKSEKQFTRLFTVRVASDKDIQQRDIMEALAKAGLDVLVTSEIKSVR